MTARLDALGAALAWVRTHPDLGVAVAAAERAGHAPLAAAASIPFVRTEVVRPAALRAWLDRADETRAIAGGATIDVLLLGAGPTNAALCLALQRARPDLAIVVVDRDAPGGPFARAGAGFRLNTWSAPGPPGMSLLDEVDLHGGLAISPSLLSGARFPTGDTLADATLLSWLSAECGAMIDEVTAVSPEGDGVSFTLAGGSAAPGEPRVLRASAAVVATGFGSGPRRSFDDAGNAFAAAEAARPIALRRALDAEALFAHADAAGLGIFDGADVAVVGGGPSALGVLALACGLGPAELTDAPGRFSRWRERPRLTWITGARGPSSARTARTAWETAGGEHRVRPGGMDYVLAEAAATLLHELVFLEDIGRLRVVPGRVETLAPDGDRVRLVVGGRELSARRAVLCTGYTPGLAHLLRLPGARTAGSLAELLAEGSAVVAYAEQDGVSEPIALTLAGARVYVVGPAIEEALTPDSSRPPFAEAAARAAAIAAILARSLPPGRGARSGIPWELLPSDHHGTGTARLQRSCDEGTGARPWDRVLAPLDALLALVPLRLAGGARTISLQLDAAGDELELRCSMLDDPATAQIARRLPARLVACAARHRTLTISVDLAPDGRVLPASAREHR